MMLHSLSTAMQSKSTIKLYESALEQSFSGHRKALLTFYLTHPIHRDCRQG